MIFLSPGKGDESFGGAHFSKQTISKVTKLFSRDTNPNERPTVHLHPPEAEVGIAARKALDAFGFPKSKKILQVGHAAYNSRHFQITHWDDILYHLREGIGWRSTKSRDILDGLEVLYRHLKSAGISAPSFLSINEVSGGLKPSNDFIIEQRTEGGKTERWTIERWMADTWRFAGRENELRALGSELGKVHKALKVLSAKVNFSEVAAGESDPFKMDCQKLLKAIKANTSSDGRGYDHVVQRDWFFGDSGLYNFVSKTGIQELIAGIAPLIKDIDSAVSFVSANLSQDQFENDGAQIIHGDVNPSNVLISFSDDPRNPNATIIDYEKIRTQNPEVDLANAAFSAIRLAVENSGQSPENVIPQLRKVFFEAYRSANPDLALNWERIRLCALNGVLQRFYIYFNNQANNWESKPAQETRFQRAGYAYAIREAMAIFPQEKPEGFE